MMSPAFYVFIASSLPFVFLLYNGVTGQLGADPVKTMTLESGIWAFNFLILCLMMSPMARYLNMPRLVRLRRQLGLWCYFYACVHVTVFFVFLLDMDISRLNKEVTERPYIIMGFGAWVWLSVMAVTTIPRLIKKMGGKNWRRLHKVIFLVAFLSFVHFLILSRSDIAAPLGYGAVVLALVAARVYYARDWWRERLSRLRR